MFLCIILSGLFDDPGESSDIVLSSLRRDADFSVYFIPAFHGLRAPVLDPKAAAGIMGLKPNSGPKDTLRAVLESVAFTMKQVQETFERESDYKLQNIQ